MIYHYLKKFFIMSTIIIRIVINQSGCSSNIGNRESVLAAGVTASVLAIVVLLVLLAAMEIVR